MAGEVLGLAGRLFRGALHRRSGDRLRIIVHEFEAEAPEWQQQPQAEQ